MARGMRHVPMCNVSTYHMTACRGATAGCGTSSGTSSTLYWAGPACRECGGSTRLLAARRGRAHLELCINLAQLDCEFVVRHRCKLLGTWAND
eukprot:2406538-Prymnesium_polylepis.1